MANPLATLVVALRDRIAALESSRPSQVQLVVAAVSPLTVRGDPDKPPSAAVNGPGLTLTVGQQVTCLQMQGSKPIIIAAGE